MKRLKNWWRRRRYRPTNIVFTRSEQPQFGGEIEFLTISPKRGAKKLGTRKCATMSNIGYRLDCQNPTIGLTHFLHDIGIGVKDCVKAFGILNPGDELGISKEFYPGMAEEVKKKAKKRKKNKRRKK